MEKYVEVDKNMLVSGTIGDVSVLWREVRREPFSLHGFYRPAEDEIYRRVPKEVAEATSPEVARLSRESAGGRARFSTDSPFIAIRAKFRSVGRSPHLTLISSAGFDLYEDGERESRFIKEFRMPYDMTDTYEAIIKVGDNGMRSYTVNFPVHSVVETLEIGLSPEAAVAAPHPYRDVLPVVIYGIVYFLQVVVFRNWMDFYAFNSGGMWYLIMPVIIGISFGMSLLIRLLRNKIGIKKGSA